MSQQAHFDLHPERTYLDASYIQKDDVKDLGGKWDPACPRAGGLGKWYIPPEVDGNVEAFSSWLPSNHPKSNANVIAQQVRARQVLSTRARQLDGKKERLEVLKRTLVSKKRELQQQRAENKEEAARLAAERKSQADEREEMRQEGKRLAEQRKELDAAREKLVKERLSKQAGDACGCGHHGASAAHSSRHDNVIVKQEAREELMPPKEEDKLELEAGAGALVRVSGTHGRCSRKRDRTSFDRDLSMLERLRHRKYE